MNAIGDFNSTTGWYFDFNGIGVINNSDDVPKMVNPDVYKLERLTNLKVRKIMNKKIFFCDIRF